MSANISFDTNGIIDHSDDLISHNPNPAVGFLDQARTTDPSVCSCAPDCICTLPDTVLGGTQHGACGFSNAGVMTVYEFRHPLNSGDAYDFSLLAGDSIRFNVFIRFIRPPSATPVPPEDFGDTSFPALSHGDPSRYGVIKTATCGLGPGYTMSLDFNEVKGQFELQVDNDAHAPVATITTTPATFDGISGLPVIPLRRDGVEDGIGLLIAAPLDDQSGIVPYIDADGLT